MAVVQTGMSEGLRARWRTIGVGDCGGMGASLWTWVLNWWVGVGARGGLALVLVGWGLLFDPNMCLLVPSGYLLARSEWPLRCVYS